MNEEKLEGVKYLGFTVSVNGEVKKERSQWLRERAKDDVIFGYG